MKVDIQFENGNVYKIGSGVMPITLTISADHEIEIARKVDVISAFLEKVDDRDVFFGFKRSILGVPSATLFISDAHPYEIEFDVLQDDDSVVEILPGQYRLLVELVVFKKTDDDFQKVQLSAESPVVVSD